MQRATWEKVKKKRAAEKDKAHAARCFRSEPQFLRLVQFEYISSHLLQIQRFEFPVLMGRDSTAGVSAQQNTFTFLEPLVFFRTP